jgi:glycosyltransferase involved in cell wall biosynthesis
MIPDGSNHPLVSVLFVTYKRVHLLQRTLDSFRKNTDYPNLELVVTDDGSPAAVQEQIRGMTFDKFVLAPKNRGMGANANSGLAACSGKYILFLQDDWECMGPSCYLRDSVAVMEANPNVAILKFYGLLHPPGNASLPGATKACYPICHDQPPGPGGYLIYSDTPHLKSRASLADLGFYREGCGMEQCELDYDTRFSTQSQYGAAFFPAYYHRVFIHTGGEDSFRKSALGYKVRQLLANWASPVREACPTLYEAARRCYRRAVRSRLW